MTTVTGTVSRRGPARRRDQVLYQRLADELAGLIDRRALRPGDRLPSVRGYSRQKRVSLATVLRTYQVLEDRGYVEVRPQSGHYVRGAPALPPSPSVQRMLPVRAEVKLADLIWELLAHVNDAGLAPFGVATAAPENYPARRLGLLVARAARDADWTGVAYGHPAGHEALLHQLVRRAVVIGVPISPDELVITNGCTEAIQLALRALARPGDAVLMESPGYYGFLELAESLGLVVVEVETDPETGVRLDALEAAVRRTKPRVFLTSPNFQNPLGFEVPVDRKRETVALLARHRVAVVEDDLYADLHFGDTRPLPLKAFDTTGDVVLCSSFSKTIAPGFRVGFVAAGRHAASIRKLKIASSIHTNTVAQLAIAEFLRGGGAEHHLRRLRLKFRTQVSDYAQAVARLFPAGTRVSRPRGGHLLWVELAAGADTLELSRRALAQRIGIVPGRLFSAGGRHANCFRLNCGWPLRGRLEAALATLGRLAAD
ncbi:MAG TPA: PLP-dependent aminotransferase family protein [Gemmatimonadales bacterium]|nr:PLP-dependent aminotransferase family protein [Gemmatimonadales bacterium]